MLDLRPTGPGIIEGIVTSDSGTPISKALVTIELISSENESPPLPLKPWSAITNPRGEFFIRDLPINPSHKPVIKYLVAARAETTEGRQKISLHYRCALQVLHIVLGNSSRDEEGTDGPLVPAFDECFDENGAFLSGFVRDSISGLPMQGVTIRTSRVDYVNELSRVTTSDPSGFYFFDHLPPGHHIVVQEEHFGYRIGRDLESKNIELHNGQTLENVDFYLKKGLLIRGRVVRNDGHPISGVKVMGTSRFDDDFCQSSLTDEEGKFVLSGYAPNSTARIRLTDSLYVATALSGITLSDSDLTGLELVAELGASIVGVVVDESGKSVPDSPLCVEHIDDDEWYEWCESGDSGEFYFRGLPAGNYNLRLRNGAERRIVLNEGEQIAGVHVVAPSFRTCEEISNTRNFISGRLRDRLGFPVPNARVSAFTRPPEGSPESHGEAESDEDGSFHIGGLGEGAHQITTCPDGHAISIVKGIPENATDVEIVLDRLIVVTGCVVDDQTDAPIREFSIARAGRVPENLEDRRLEFSTCHDPEGNFSVWGYPGGIAVIVRASGYKTTYLWISDVEEGMELEDQEIRLTRTWSQ